MKVYPVTAVRAMDTAAIASGTSGVELMRRAGSGAVEEILTFVDTFPLGTVKRFVVLCGKGNNGGDGFVVAQGLLECGYDVRVIAVQPLKDYSGDALFFADKMGSDTEIYSDGPESFLSTLKIGDWIVDALLGTGFQSPLRSFFKAWIDAVNVSGCPVISLDVPSGLNADSGAADTAVHADMTVTFSVPKPGLIHGEGPAYCGLLRVCDIGISQEIVTRFESVDELFFTAHDARTFLGRFSPYAYKGTRGRVMCLAGSGRYGGAGALCSEAALRAGCGMSVLSTSDRAAFGHLPNAVMVRRLTSDAGGFIKFDADILSDLHDWPDVIAAGSGLGRTADIQCWIRHLLSGKFKSRRLVLDADALFELGLLSPISKGYDVVITPHMGEAEHLAKSLGIELCKSIYLTKNRIDFASKIAEKVNSVVVLKGPRTVVVSPDGKCSVNGSGCAALATAGSGDVLTGMISGFFASGLSGFDAACLGVFVHGMLAETYPGASRTLLADDLLTMLPFTLKKLSPFA